MPTVHTSIPVGTLPTELTDPNRIVAEYESYTLIPRLGPLAYAYVRRIGRKRLDHIKKTYRLLGAVQKHKNKWNESPRLSVDALQLIRNPISVVGNVTERLANVVRAPAAGGGQPLDILHEVRELSAPQVEALSSATGANSAQRNSQLIDSNNQILQAMSQPNPIIETLVESGKLLDQEGSFQLDIAALPDAEKMTKIVEATRHGGRNPTDVEKAVAKTIVDREFEMSARNRGEYEELVIANQPVRELLIGSLADALKGAGLLGNLQSIDDSVIVDSREWAFLRHERVELMLGQPQFRGPLSVDSVAPNSELSYSSSEAFESQQIDITSRERGNRSGTSQLVSSQIKEKLGTLYDYGSNLGQTMSEQGFSRDSSKGEKRSIVEATLLEMSEKNASKTISASKVSSASLREYRTEGKDTNFATTEVSFEAFSPVDVTHYLDEIGAVWSPRMRNPFLALRQTINEFEQAAEAQYIEENYVVDPAEPLPTYEGIERVSVDSVKVLEDDYEDDTGHIYVADVTIRLSEADRSQHYFLGSDVVCEFHQDTSDDDFEADQYMVLDPIVLEHIPNESITIRTSVQILDFPFWDDPDYFFVRSSVTKYKYTSAYLEQIREYNNTIGSVNVARRAAVRAQAKKYARLKKEELINRYRNDPAELRDYTFVALMKMMFGTSADAHWSYYHGIIKSCIDWDRAQIESEPADPSNLAASGLSPYHFLNVNAVRFFLPIHKESEEAFFEAVSNTLDASWKALFAKVKEYIDTQRELVAAMSERMNDDDIAQLTLDNYSSELVLGRHLEAVLSHTTFLEE